jgi:hypothetical protein
MVTSSTWQFPHTFWNGGTIGLAIDNTPIIWEQKTICSNGKVNEDEHKHREMRKKGRSKF